MKRFNMFYAVVTSIFMVFGQTCGMDDWGMSRIEEPESKSPSLLDTLNESSILDPSTASPNISINMPETREQSPTKKIIHIIKPKNEILTALKDRKSSYFKQCPTCLAQALPYFMHRAQYSDQDRKNAVNILNITIQQTNDLSHKTTLKGYIGKIQKKNSMEASAIPTILNAYNPKLFKLTFGQEYEYSIPQEISVESPEIKPSNQNGLLTAQIIPPRTDPLSLFTKAYVDMHNLFSQTAGKSSLSLQKDKLELIVSDLTTMINYIIKNDLSRTERKEGMDAIPIQPLVSIKKSIEGLIADQESPTYTIGTETIENWKENIGIAYKTTIQNKEHRAEQQKLFKKLKLLKQNIAQKGKDVTIDELNEYKETLAQYINTLRQPVNPAEEKKKQTAEATLAAISKKIIERESQQKVNLARQQVESITTRITENTQQIKSLASQRQEEIEKISTLQQQLAESTQQIQSLTSQHQEEIERITTLQEQQESLAKEEEKIKKKIEVSKTLNSLNAAFAKLYATDPSQDPNCFKKAIKAINMTDNFQKKNPENQEVMNLLEDFKKKLDQKARITILNMLVTPQKQVQYFNQDDFLKPYWQLQHEIDTLSKNMYDPNKRIDSLKILLKHRTYLANLDQEELTKSDTSLVDNTINKIDLLVAILKMQHYLDETDIEEINPSFSSLLYGNISSIGHRIALANANDLLQIALLGKNEFVHDFITNTFNTLDNIHQEEIINACNSIHGKLADFPMPERIINPTVQQKTEIVATTPLIFPTTLLENVTTPPTTPASLAQLPTDTQLAIVTHPKTTTTVPAPDKKTRIESPTIGWREYLLYPFKAIRTWFNSWWIGTQ